MKLLTRTCLTLFSFYACAQEEGNYQQMRFNMVKNQIIARGIHDENTINALRKVPRHLFVPASLTKDAYIDSPLPIGYDQTISQPYIVALMTELSNPSKEKKALEIGTGSGYQAAVLAEIVKEVYTIEIVPELAKSAKEKLIELGYKNVFVKQGDGYKGWQEHAPYDIIIITAACDHIPQSLIDQLNENGRLIMPIGNPKEVQDLILVQKKNGKITKKVITKVVFVPFTRQEE